MVLIMFGTTLGVEGLPLGVGVEGNLLVASGATFVPAGNPG